MAKSATKKTCNVQNFFECFCYGENEVRKKRCELLEILIMGQFAEIVFVTNKSIFDDYRDYSSNIFWRVPPIKFLFMNDENEMRLKLLLTYIFTLKMLKIIRSAINLTNCWTDDQRRITEDIRNATQSHDEENFENVLLEKITQCKRAIIKSIRSSINFNGQQRVISKILESNHFSDVRIFVDTFDVTDAMNVEISKCPTSKSNKTRKEKQRMKTQNCHNELTASNTKSNSNESVNFENPLIPFIGPIEKNVQQINDDSVKNEEINLKIKTDNDPKLNDLQAQFEPQLNDADADQVEDNTTLKKQSGKKISHQPKKILKDGNNRNEFSSEKCSNSRDNRLRKNHDYRTEPSANNEIENIIRRIEQSVSNAPKFLSKNELINGKSKNASKRNNTNLSIN